MPDRATILAATPKCPVPLPRCWEPLRWDHRHAVWVCAVHGNCMEGAALVARQHTITATVSA